MTDRPIPETGFNARRGCVLIGTGLFAILVIWAVVMAHLFVVANRPPSIRIPSHSMPTPNAYDDWMAAGKMLSGLRPMGPVSDTRPVESWTLPQLKEFVDANQPVFDLFRQGLREQYKHPPIRGAGQHNDLFPMFARYRELARRLLSESMYYRAAGQPGSAASSCLDAVELGVRMPDGGPLLTALVGIAVEAIGCYGLPQIVPVLSRDQLHQVQTRIERIQGMRVPVSEIILEEGRCTVAQLQESLSQGPLMGGALSLSAIRAGTAIRAADLLAGITFAFRNKQAMLEDMLRFYEEVAHSSTGSYFTGIPELKTPDGMMAWMTGDTAAKFGPHLAMSAAVLELLRTDCALRRYRTDHGRYPDSLSQLVPRYVKSVPIDPCGGKPLKYRPLKGGRDFLLYSIGTDLKDDGGLAGKYRDPAAKSDIVEGRWHE